MKNLKVLLLTSFIFIYPSCSEQGFYKALDGIDSTLRVTNNLLDAYDRVKEEVDSYNNNRGADFIDMSTDVKEGDLLEGQKKEDFLSGFLLAGYGDSSCRIYLCKEDTSIPCNPKISDCNCKCAYK